MHLNRTLIALSCLACWSQISFDSAKAEVRVVDQGGQGQYTSIQDAILDSHHGDQILVHPGTYQETLFYGGRRISVESTDGPEVTTIDANGSGAVAVFIIAEPREAVLRGFTLTGGIGNPLSTPAPTGMEPADLSQHPLGVHDPTVSRLLDDQENRQLRYGGAIFCQTASPTFENLIIEDNASNYGGAIYSEGGNPLIKGCRMVRNIAGNGGALCFTTAAPKIEECFVAQNSSVYGGGLYGFGSGIDCHLSVFESNSSAEGGAWYLLYSPQLSAAHHTIFWKNIGADGSACMVIGSSLDLRYDVFSQNNIQGYDPAAVSYIDSSGELRNNNFLGDLISRDLNCADSDVSYFCNNFYPGPIPEDTCSPMTSNFSRNPLFCEAMKGDFTLRSDSPCLPENSPGSCGIVGPFMEPGCQQPNGGIRHTLEQVMQERYRRQ